MQHDKIVIIELGGGSSQTIAKKIRNLNVYSEVLPNTTTASKISLENTLGIIITGKYNISDDIINNFDSEILNIGLPVLGVGFGAKLVALKLGAKVWQVSALNKQYSVKANLNSALFDGIDDIENCTFAHTDFVQELPNNCLVNASAQDFKFAAFECTDKKFYGVQFGLDANLSGVDKMLGNFLYKICGATGDWTIADFIEKQVALLKQKIGNGKVLCALSGGVDSAVAAALIHRAVGNQLICVFVDHGLMRYNEPSEVVEVFKDGLGMNLIAIDAGQRFLSKLENVVEPEQKRKIIGEEFIRVFEEQAKVIGKVSFLVQGTIYPDVIESGLGAALVKSHHNVGGLPSVINFDEIIEPLRDLFKDEVRKVGFGLGLPEKIVLRQPFPGPGLGIRIIGDITKQKVNILQRADKIYRDEIAAFGLDKKIWQYFCVLTPIKTVGVFDDARTYGYTLALRAVNSVDGMTAQYVKIPYEVLESASSKITQEITEINRVVYDITSKPPATIEWE